MATSLPPFKTFITTNSPDGTSTFLSEESSTSQSFGPQVFHLIYSTKAGLISLSDNKDLEYSATMAQKRPLPIFPTGAGGSVCAVIDYLPNSTGEEGMMHRTQTLDYLFMMAGELELSLGSGEKRMLKAGDVVVQRTSLHSFRNPSATQAARIAGVCLGAEEVVMGGQVLKQSF